MWSRLVWTKSEDPLSKRTREKRGGDVAQEVMHLPNKHEAMSSRPSTTKKERKKEGRNLGRKEGREGGRKEGRTEKLEEARS
jgi:hypothetical protein